MCIQEKLKMCKFPFKERRVQKSVQNIFETNCAIYNKAFRLLALSEGHGPMGQLENPENLSFLKYFLSYRKKNDRQINLTPPTQAGLNVFVKFMIHCIAGYVCCHICLVLTLTRLKLIQMFDSNLQKTVVFIILASNPFSHHKSLILCFCIPLKVSIGYMLGIFKK